MRSIFSTGALVFALVGMWNLDGNAAVVLFTAGVDSSGMTDPQSVPAVANPHIPPIDGSVILSPSAPVDLDGVATGPLNGIVYGPVAFGGSTGGTTGWVHVTYVVAAAALGLPLFIEVSDVGDSGVDSAVAIDNITVNSVLFESFEAGIPGGWTQGGFGSVSGPVVNLAPTHGGLFAFLDTTGFAPAVFDTVDGTTAGNLFAPVPLALGDVLEFDIAFLTTDGTAFFHDYAIASLGVPNVVGTVPEPGSLVLLGLGAVLLGGQQIKRRRNITS